MSKIKTEKKPFSATSMRLLLGASLPLTLGLMLGGFYLAYTSLSAVAKEASDTQLQADTADAQLQELINTEAQLKKYEDIMRKSQGIVAESQSYRYQDQVIGDLTAYARRAGVAISSFIFQEGEAATGGSTAESNTGSTTPSATTDSQASNDGGTEGQAQSTTPQPQTQGPKTTQVSVQLGDSVRYENLLHFIHLIEENLTKMQIAEFSISPTEDGNNVIAQTLNIEVYIK